MIALGWLVALIAAAGALVLPFSRGAPFVLALAPFANAYGSAGAIGLMLLRWAVLEMPGLPIPRATLRKVSVALAFLAGAVTLSLLVADDLLRLSSEIAQWIVGVGWFCALLVGGNQPHEERVVRGMVIGGVALAVAHVFMRLFEVRVDETAVMPFLISEANNYAAMYALIALVVLPLHPRAGYSTQAYLLLAGLGIMVTLLHESRAQTLLGAGVVAGALLLRYVKSRAAIMSIAGVALLALLVALNLLRESMFSADSVVSLANFQTNYSNLERLGLILHSLDFFAANPLGAGIGASSDIFPDSPYTIGSYPTPHNTFAMMIVEIGWLGCIAYLLTVVALLRVGIRACLSAEPFGMAALTAVALTIVDAVFFNGSVSLVFWLLLAFSVQVGPEESRERIPMLFVRKA